jgi:hypothetical protein
MHTEVEKNFMQVSNRNWEPKGKHWGYTRTEMKTVDHFLPLKCGKIGLNVA